MQLILHQISLISFVAAVLFVSGIQSHPVEFGKTASVVIRGNNVAVKDSGIQFQRFRKLVASPLQKRGKPNGHSLFWKGKKEIQKESKPQFVHYDYLSAQKDGATFKLRGQLSAMRDHIALNKATLTKDNGGRLSVNLPQTQTLMPIKDLAHWKSALEAAQFTDNSLKSNNKPLVNEQITKIDNSDLYRVQKDDHSMIFKGTFNKDTGKMLLNEIASETESGRLVLNVPVALKHEFTLDELKQITVKSSIAKKDKERYVLPGSKISYGTVAIHNGNVKSLPKSFRLEDAAERKSLIDMIQKQKENVDHVEAVKDFETIFTAEPVKQTNAAPATQNLIPSEQNEVNEKAVKDSKTIVPEPEPKQKLIPSEQNVAPETSPKVELQQLSNDVDAIDFKTPESEIRHEVTATTEQASSAPTLTPKSKGRDLETKAIWTSAALGASGAVMGAISLAVANKDKN